MSDTFESIKPQLVEILMDLGIYQTGALKESLSNKLFTMNIFEVTCSPV